jgi:hypothetical protein
MSPPSIYELCRPRTEVLEGGIREEDFAADLSQVIQGKGPELYCNPALFFAHTHPTRGLRELFQAVVDRLTGAGSQRGSLLRLASCAGSGKTHALIGLRHILTAADSIANVSEFIQPSLLPSQPVTVAAFDGANVDTRHGSAPWGELALQLAGPAGCERLHNSDRPGATPPDAETLRAWIGERPVLILLDALPNSWQKRNPRAAGPAQEPLLAFLTQLIQAVNASPRAVLVFTLARGPDGPGVDACAEEHQPLERLVAELEPLTGRQLPSFTPSGDDEIAAVLCRRLFAWIDRSWAEEVVRAYQQIWRRHGEALPQLAGSDDRAGELRRGYPFHPDLIQTLLEKTASLENFPRLRGMLRLLSPAVGQLWREQPRAFAIHLHHLDPGHERIRSEIGIRSGQQAFLPAMQIDVSATAGEGSNALAQRLDADEFSGLEPYGSMVARTVLFHSLARPESLQGLHRWELHYSLYAPAIDPAFVDESVRLLQAESGYLDDSGTGKLRFLTTANLNQMVRLQEQQCDRLTLRQELNARIAVIFAKQRFALVPFPASPADIPDDTGGPYLAVLHWEEHRVDPSRVQVPELVVRLFQEKGDKAQLRQNRNNVVFVCADRLQVDDMLRHTRTLLALQQLQQADRFASLQRHQQVAVKERYGQAQQAVALAVQQTYQHVFYPERGPWPDVPLTHAALPVTHPSSAPGAGQRRVERVLREARKLVLAEDSPPAPNAMAAQTPLRSDGVISTQRLRQEYCRDPSLPILLGDQAFKSCLRMGLEEGLFVYREGERLEGKGLPPGILSIREDARIFLLDKALEMGVWPPPRNDPSTPGSLPFAGSGERWRELGTAPPPPPPPAVIERIECTDSIQSALTQLAQQVNRSGKGIQTLTWRMTSGDGFVPLALLNAEPGASLGVEITEGGWRRGDGGAEWNFTFRGAPEEAAILRSFLEGQWRRGGEKGLAIIYHLHYSPPLLWQDGGASWISRLASFAIRAQVATIRLGLTTVPGEQP